MPQGGYRASKNGLTDVLALGSPKLRRTVVRHLHDLAGLALQPEIPVPEERIGTLPSARLHTVIKEIERRFEDPGFSVVGVARSHGLSPRYLQRLLETTGISFTERLTEMRLQRAMSLVGATRLRVSDVALQAGFSDISNFNRLFWRRFGETPSASRNQARD